MAAIVAVPATRHMNLAGSSATSFVPPVADTLPVGSIWIGTQSQEGREGNFTIVMHVGSRLDDAFDATVWWPDLNGGLIKASGRIGPKREVTLDFGTVVHNPKTPKGYLFEGAKTRGTLARDTLECEGKFQLTADKDPIEVAYRFKRVQ